MNVPRQRLSWSLRPRSRRPGSTGRHRRRPIIEELEAYVLLSTFTVTATTDDGTGQTTGTLSWAIDQVNNDTGDSTSIPDTIGFNLGTGPKTITPSAALPALINPAIVDGTTEPGYAGKPIVQVGGSGVTTSNNTGVFLAPGSDGSTVQGLVISNFTGDGIFVDSAGNTITNDYVGTNLAGNAKAGNTFNGIEVFTSGNMIRGDVVSGNGFSGISLDDAGATNNSVAGNTIGLSADASIGLGNDNDGVFVGIGASGNTISGNIIAANSFDGVTIDAGGVTTMSNVVAGNIIGTNAGTGGATNLGNGNAGVSIFGAATGNTIGGTTAAASNLITENGANGFGGVDISDSGTSGNVVEGNSIVHNLNDGVDIFGGATGNTIGGTSVFVSDAQLSPAIVVGGSPANIISGNGSGGLDITDSGTSGNVVEGNFIGTNAAGATGLGNALVGLTIFGGASDNTIGGTAPGAANTIADNDVGGLNIEESGTSGNVVEGNSIVNNTFDGVIILSGATGNTIGGTTAAAANTIASNTVDGVGISDAGTSGNVVAGNYIGTNASGATGLGNSGNGVSISGGATGNTIGGIAPGAANTLASNGDDGVGIFGAGTSGNVVEGNHIGTNASAATGLGNTFQGVFILNGATGNTIGGTAPGAANVIAGNGTAATASHSYDNVEVDGAGTSGNVVEGNFIGTDASGTTGLNAPDDYGVFLGFGSSGNTIGGAGSAARNIISGNTSVGVYIYDAGPAGNLVEGNYIGTNVAGTAPLPNQAEGVLIGTDNTAGETSTNNTISGNVIAGNGPGNSGSGSGVAINNAGSNLIENNYIGTNASNAPGLGNGTDGVHILPNTFGSYVGIGAPDNTIVGNVIADNAQNGVQIDGPGSTGNVVKGNFIGTNASGATGLGNTLSGVLIDQGANGNTIGGTATGAGNTIGSNLDDGVDITDSGTSGNVVEGNFIGTNAAAAAGLGNTFQGVGIFGGATGNTIGGTTAAAANVIAGNGLASTSIHSYANLEIGEVTNDTGTSNNLVEGNFIGTNASGTTGLNPSYTFGAFIGYGATDNTLGGVAAGAGNVIAGNTGPGVVISGVGTTGNNGTTGNLVQGNFIGTDAHGDAGLGNGGQAGAFASDDAGVLIHNGASGNTIGGTAAGAGNVIANNQGNGVTVGDGATDTTIDDAILGNSIHGNTKLGIDLGDDGVTQNDSAGHTGPNLFQDFPVITLAASNSSGTTITGTVSGPAGSSLRVELFANPSADPSGYGQGQTFLAFVVVAINGSGQGSFTYTTTTQIAQGQVVTATATDASGDTSEFSKDVTVMANVTSQVGYQITGPVYNPFKHVYTETLTLTNDGATTIAGPIQVVLDGLTPGVTLTNPSGTAPDGSPYVTSNTSLAPGQSATVTLTFTKTSSDLYIDYTPEFYSGSFPS